MTNYLIGDSMVSFYDLSEAISLFGINMDALLRILTISKTIATYGNAQSNSGIAFALLAP